MRVQLSAFGIRQGLQGHAKTIFGTAKARPSTKEFILVRRDGQKTWSSYAVVFWEPIASPEETPDGR